jgi:hypothetical protein
MDPQMTEMFMALMAQNQQLMNQLMTQNANIAAAASVAPRTTWKRKLLKELPAMTITEFLANQEFEYLSLADLNGYSLPEFYAQNILLNLNKYNAEDKPLQLVDKRRKKMYYKEGDKWLSDDNWFKPIYHSIFKHYCGKFAKVKTSQNTFTKHEETDDYIDEIQSLIGKFYDVTKYPFSVLKEKTITCLINKMVVEFDE